MCGIVGWIGRAAALDIDAGVRALHHRGPDGRGTWLGRLGDREARLGHTRLAVIDLSPGGAQPMTAASGKVAITFNGEIYNYRQLRAELEALGHTFRSQSDTEVLLEGYLRWGCDVVHRLRGMFAFALWDGRDGTALLARDRLGIKPLYVAGVAGALAFSSEIKGLFAMGVARRERLGAIDDFLTYLYVPGPGTAFEGVDELLPGTTMRIASDGRARRARYWSVPDTDDRIRDEREVELAVRAELETVIAQHAVSDVPIGAFLSGGIDSSTIVGLMQQRASKPLRTFCMVFGQDASLYDERVYAREVAAWFGTEHTEIEVRPNVVEALPRMLHAFDQPFGNPTALLSLELSRLTRQHVTVALAGDGGDEAFLGYPRYAGAALAERLDWAPSWARRGASVVAERLITESSSGNHRYRRAREFLTASTLAPVARYASWVGYFDAAERARLLTPEHRASRPPEQFLSELFDEQRTGEAPDRAAAVDLRSFLPNNVLAYGDRASMAHALELRVPYCDHGLVELAARIPARMRMRGFSLKRVLRGAVRDLLPPRIVRRPKLGFNPPIGVWIQRDLAGLVDRYLAPEALRRTHTFRPEGVLQLLAELRAGRRDVALKVWAVLVVQAWREHARLD